MNSIPDGAMWVATEHDGSLTYAKADATGETWIQDATDFGWRRFGVLRSTIESMTETWAPIDRAVRPHEPPSEGFLRHVEPTGEGYRYVRPSDRPGIAAAKATPAPVEFTFALQDTDAGRGLLTIWQPDRRGVL